jgi:uncharacterized integral membrane protein
MAANDEPQVEMKAHAKSYDLFIAVMKWGTIVAGIVALIVVLIIAN